MSDRICVGAIAGSFGVNGEVRLKSFCAEPAAIAGYSLLFTQAGTDSYTVKIVMAIKSGFSARLSGVDTKEQAEALKGLRLFVDRDRLPSLPDDEYYYSDLTGLLVLDTGGRELGKVTAVLNHGAGDLLEVSGPTLKTPALIPFTLEAVPTVDLASRRIIVDPPEGLLPEPGGS